MTAPVILQPETVEKDGKKRKNERYGIPFRRDMMIVLFLGVWGGREDGGRW